MLTKVGTSSFTVEYSEYRKKFTLRSNFRSSVEFDASKIDELINLLIKAKEELQ